MVSKEDAKLGGEWNPGFLDFLRIGLAVAGFLASHWFSYRKNVEDDLRAAPTWAR